jgi:hypothetical protein
MQAVGRRRPVPQLNHSEKKTKLVIKTAIKAKFTVGKNRQT